MAEAGMFKLHFNDGMSHTDLCSSIFDAQLNALFWTVVGFPGHRAWLAEAGHWEHAFEG